MLPYILVVIWIGVLLLFRKLNIYFFVFVVGSVGLFCFSMHFGINSVEKYLEYAVTYGLYLVENFTGLFTAHPQYSMITTYYRGEALTFFVDYECSGIVEMLVYSCLVLFYPLYKIILRAVYCIFGTIYIFVANIVRVLSICIIAKLFGPSVFFFSHTIFARLLFFLFMVILYYIVFTHPHVKLQKVGELYSEP